MKYISILKKVIEVIPKLLKKFKETSKVYIGKTEDTIEYPTRHEQDDKLFYLTI